MFTMIEIIVLSTYRCSALVAEFFDFRLVSVWTLLNCFMALKHIKARNPHRALSFIYSKFLQFLRIPIRLTLVKIVLRTRSSPHDSSPFLQTPTCAPTSTLISGNPKFSLDNSLIVATCAAHFK